MFRVESRSSQFTFSLVPRLISSLRERTWVQGYSPSALFSALTAREWEGKGEGEGGVLLLLLDLLVLVLSFMFPSYIVVHRDVVCCPP